MARTIVYIDGHNFQYGMKTAYGHKYLWLDLVRLAARLRPQDTIAQVRYFTAMTRNDEAAHGIQQTYLRALAIHSGAGIDIQLGKHKRRTQRCRLCLASWNSYEEKETDVNIAVSLVEDAAEQRADTAVVISADSDLCPAIRAVSRIAPAQRVYLAFPPKRRSKELENV
ncbi:MAG: NYN domain-containing protein, partial [Stackebrandtia sp.]